ncbi:hypothetical protein [Stenotrophomonas humi]|uniref:hypothetical protein n=1 Tax=Stenotrophomonas humi TaxID=405444 RepID=UPI000A7D9C9A|nr:hypothetical protein [Stenotrophomonas humi]
MHPSTESFIFSTAALLLGVLTLIAIRSGQVLSASSLIEISRAQQPVIYWVVIAVQIIGVAAFVWLACV